MRLACLKVLKTLGFSHGKSQQKIKWTIHRETTVGLKDQKNGFDKFKKFINYSLKTKATRRGRFKCFIGVN